MAKLIDLPPEIQYSIYHDLFHSQDFVNVCITCKTMNKIATPLLYEMVNIVTNDEYEWEDRQVRCLTEMDNRSMGMIKQLLNFCVRPKNTTQCFKLIDRMGEDQLHCIELFQKGSHGDDCSNVVKALFEKNKRLRAIYLDMGEEPLYTTFFPLISLSANWLVTLILVIEKKESFLYNIDNLVSFLQGLRYLRSLELDMVEYYEDSPWAGEDGVKLMDSVFSLEPLEQLVFGGSDFPYGLYSERYPTKKIGNRLTQFGYFSGVSCDTFLTQNFDPTRLRALRILWPVETDFQLLFNFLMSFEGLRSLHLTLRNPDSLPSLACIAHHGKTLERLSLRAFTPENKPFGSFQHSHTDFGDMLKNCPALRELAVPLSYTHQFWFDDDPIFDKDIEGVPDILWADLDWRFQWPNHVSHIESLHILNEPIPAVNTLRDDYKSTQRRRVITTFAKAFFRQLNIRGVPDATNGLPPRLREAEMETGTPLLPSLRSLLFGDNTKCGRDSCLYSHDWDFEEMDLVPVIIDKVDPLELANKKSLEEEGKRNEPDLKSLDWFLNDPTRQDPGLTKEEIIETLLPEPDDDKIKKYKFTEVDWAEFVGRFPWLHDFEIDARGWMDERTRIDKKDKFRFWE